MAEKTREAKGKGEKERYTHLNAEFQRIARTDKKAFLSDQCKKRKRIEWERLAWRDLVGCSPRGCKESDTTEVT